MSRIRKTETLTRELLRCDRCGYEWEPVDWNRLPATCPKSDCRSTCWNKPRRERATAARHK